MHKEFVKGELYYFDESSLKHFVPSVGVVEKGTGHFLEIEEIEFADTTWLCIGKVTHDRQVPYHFYGDFEMLVGTRIVYMHQLSRRNFVRISD